MKKLGAFALVMVLAVSTVAVVSAQDAAKPQKGMLVGTAVEISSYAMKGLSADDAVDVMKSRAEQGFPVGIVENETGVLWIPVYRSAAPASPMTTANEHLAPLLGKVVAMQGLKYKQGNVNVIRFNLVSEY
jgi:hypothetical protein